MSTAIAQAYRLNQTIGSDAIVDELPVIRTDQSNATKPRRILDRFNLIAYFNNWTHTRANIVSRPITLRVEQNEFLDFAVSSLTPSFPVAVSDTADLHQSALQWIKEEFDLSDDRMKEILGVSRQTISAWRKGEAISDPNRQHLLQVRQVLEVALKMQGGQTQARVWLETPRGSDRVTPAQHLAAGNFDRARMLAVTRLSPRVKPARSESSAISRKYRRIEAFDIPDMDDDLED